MAVHANGAHQFPAASNPAILHEGADIMHPHFIFFNIFMSIRYLAVIWETK